MRLTTFMMKNPTVLVDADDLAKFGDTQVSVNNMGYLLLLGTGSLGSVYLHRQILVCDADIVDHKNGDKFDNRKDNLRPATHSQNSANKRKSSTSGSQFKGVTWEHSRSKWKAHIETGGRHINLGRFLLAVDAAKAYNKAALTIFGEFALLNKVD